MLAIFVELYSGGIKTKVRKRQRSFDAPITAFLMAFASFMGPLSLNLSSPGPEPS